MYRHTADLVLSALCIAACALSGAGCEPVLGGADTLLGGQDAKITTGVEPKFTSLYGDYFSHCRQCHAPGAPGRTSITEKTLDFTSSSTAFSTLRNGKASGMIGAAAACNGAPFVVVGQPGSSLVVAVVDESTRQAFDLASHPACDVNTISDMTVKVGDVPSTAFVGALKTWIQDGAPND